MPATLLVLNLLGVVSMMPHDVISHDSVVLAVIYDVMTCSPRDVVGAVFEARGAAKGDAGDPAGAAADFLAALAAGPRPGAVVGLARARLELGEDAGVESAATIGLGLLADDAARAELLGLRCESRGRRGDWAGALADAARAAQLQPADPRHPVACGDACVKLNRPTEAAEEYRVALRLAPEFGLAAHRLAWLLATCADAKVRDGGTAVVLARRAADPVTLAAALAESGDFAGAVSSLSEVMPGVPEPIAADLRRQLACYERRTPWRE